MSTFKVGDIVKSADADAPESIPAYRSMRGYVAQVHESGQALRVRWYDPATKHRLGDDVNWRRASSVVLAEK